MGLWLWAGGAAAADRARILNLLAQARSAAALAFIDFVMQPEISASVTRFIGFATANAAAVPLLEPAVRDNTLIYPPPAIRRRFELQPAYTTLETRAFTRAWLSFKSGL